MHRTVRQSDVVQVLQVHKENYYIYELIESSVIVPDSFPIK